MRHPGRGRTARSASEVDAELALWDRFRTGYSHPFLQKIGYEDDPLDAGYLLDLISEGAWEPTRDGTLSPVSKPEVFRQFMDPIAPDDDLIWEGKPPVRHETVEDAEAALAFLVAEGLAEVDGEEIRVPERFSVKPLPTAGRYE